MLKNLAAAAFAALFLTAFVSCDKEPENNDKGNDTQTSYTLELKYKTHEVINIPQENADVRKIELNTNLKKDQIKVTEKNGRDWCTAEIIEENGGILIQLSPVNDMFDKDLSAVFTVEAVGIEGVKPFEFTVTRAKLITLTLSPEFDFNYFAKPEGETLTLTVNTNAEKWNFKDEAPGDKSWYTINPSEGTDGTTVTIEFKKNTTSGEYGNIGNFQFGVYKTTDAEGQALPEPVFEALQFFTVMQPLYVESSLTATSVTVSDMMSGEIANGGNIEIEADPFMPAYLTITATPEKGGYEVKFCETGTSDELSSAWLSLDVMGEANQLNAQTNTGAQRKADMVIIGAGNKEIFRCTVTQAGA